MIWQFTSIWNDFLFAVTITSNPATQPITVGLNNLEGSYIVEWNVQMAGALLTALPTLLVYIFPGALLHARVDGGVAERVSREGQRTGRI